MSGSDAGGGVGPAGDAQQTMIGTVQDQSLMGGNTAATQGNSRNSLAQNVGSGFTSALTGMEGIAGSYKPSNVGNPRGVNFADRYENPYQQQVIDRSMRTFDDNAQKDLNMIGGRADQAGAFGGSRHGLVEAQSINDNALNRGDFVTRMNQQGFDTSQGLGQQDADRRLTSKLANQDAGYKAFGANMASYGSLGSMAERGYGMNRDINSDMFESGKVSRSIIQDIINASKGQTSGYNSAGDTSLDRIIGAITGVGGAGSGGNTATTTDSPGILSMLEGASSAGSSFALK